MTYGSIHSRGLRFWVPGVLILIFLFSTLGSALAQNLRCDICNKSIRGKYYKSGDHVVCDTCYRLYDKCPGCGMPVKSSRYTYNGKKVCSSCVRKAGTCGSCGEVLLGRYYPAKHDRSVKGFCEDCYKSKPHCIGCGLPFPDMKQTAAGPICRVCESRLERCSSCNKPLTDTYFKIDHVDGKFCKDCFENHPHCDFCGRPVLNGGKTYPDKRLACLHCSNQSVTSQEEMLAILKDVAKFCEEDLKIPAPRAFDFIMVDNNQMKVIADGRNPVSIPTSKGTGSRLKELGFVASRLTAESPRMTMAILSDLPRTATMETIAHEYAHLWQFEENPSLSDLELIEGFAQWVAAKYLLHKHEWAAYAKLYSRDDPVYGQGFQRVLRTEKRSSIKGVVSYVKAYQKKDNVRAFRIEKARTEPLGEILSRRVLDGKFGFLKNAIVITPSVIKEP